MKLSSGIGVRDREVDVDAGVEAEEGRGVSQISQVGEERLLRNVHAGQDTVIDDGGIGVVEGVGIGVDLSLGTPHSPQSFSRDGFLYAHTPHSH